MRTARLRRAGGVDDVQELARRALPRAVLDFVEGGAEDELTVARNREVLQGIGFVPRVLADVSVRSQATSLLGTPVRSPVVLAPVGLAALAHPDGEVAAARAASRAGVVSTLSSSSAWSLEDVAASCEGPKWFQLYVWRDRELTRKVVERARAAGFLVLCLTVDVPVAGRRSRDLRNGFTVPPRPRLRQAGDLVRHAGWFGRLARNDDPLRLVCTSGTESRPEGVMLSSRWLVAQYVGHRRRPPQARRSARRRGRAGTRAQVPGRLRAPKDVVLAESLPENASGKMLERELRQQPPGLAGAERTT